MIKMGTLKQKIVALAFLSGLLMFINVNNLNASETDYSQQFGNGNSFDIDVHPDKITERWQLDPSGVAGLGLTDFLRDSTPCISSDGSMVFVYGNVANPTGKIVALSTFNGSVIWSIDVPAYVDYWSWSSPVYHQGYVYWAGSNGSGTAHVYKINALNGSTEEDAGGWITVLPDSVEIVNASPTVGGGKVFISSYAGFDPSSARHYALNESNGEISWSNNDGGQGQGAMAYDASRDLVYQTVYSGIQHVLRAYNVSDGSVAWTAPWAFTNTPYQCGITFRNDKIYVQDSAFSADGKMYVADAANSGALLWDPAPLTADSGNAAPAVDPSGNVYSFAGAWGEVGNTRAYDSLGNILWTNIQGGGGSASPAWAGGYIFSGVQGVNELNVLNDSDGVIAKTVPGGGPVAFGHRTFFTVGTDGILYAYSTGNDFANEVIDYTQGTGVGNDSLDGQPYTDPSCALGRPTVDTTGDNSAILMTEPVPVVNIYGAARSFEVVSIGTGGSLTLKFDHEITNDTDNPFGVDFILFGNSYQIVSTGGSWDNRDPSSFTTNSSVYEEPATVSVSQDGVTWYTFTSGPYADTFSPTWGRVYDDVNPYQPDGTWSWNNWWGEATDPTLPIDPSWTGSTFNEKTVKEASQMCGISAGGTGFDISSLGLNSIQYVKITTTGAVPEIDAVADARIVQDTTAASQVTDFTATVNGSTIELNWTNPSDPDFEGVIVVRKKGTDITSAPVNGVAYSTDYNDLIGTADVLYRGNGTSFVETGVTSGTYYYQIFTYDKVLNYSAAVSANDTVAGTAAYTVEFETDGSAGATITGTLVQTITEGGNCTEVEAQTPVGYTFAGWSGDYTGSTNPLTITNVTSDMIIMANYDVAIYQVTFVEGDHGSRTGGGALMQDVAHGSDAVSPIMTSDTGWVFTGWDTAFDNVTSDLTVNAVYAVAYNLTANNAWSGLNVNNGLGWTQFPEGAVVYVYPNAPAGQHFTEWTGDIGYLNDPYNAYEVFNMPATDVTLTANFAAGDTPHSADTDSNWRISQTEVESFISSYSNNDNAVSDDTGSITPGRITMREVMRVIYLYNKGLGSYIGGQATVDGYEIIFTEAAPQTANASEHPAGDEEDGSLVVSSTANSGVGSLRDAIAIAADGETITIDESLDAIILIEEILIDKSITINGQGVVIVSGDKQTRVFRVENSLMEIDVTLKNMGIVDATNYGDEFGGAIYNNDQTLTLDTILFDGNSNIFESGKGGAVYSSGKLNVDNCVFRNNSALEENDIYSTNDDITLAE